jgi:hypothetical protein
MVGWVISLMMVEVKVKVRRQTGTEMREKES